MPEEITAYNLVIFLIFSSHSCLLILTIMEILFFWLYNSKFHPFRMILLSEGISIIFIFQNKAKGLNCNHFNFLDTLEMMPMDTSINIKKVSDSNVKLACKTKLHRKLDNLVSGAIMTSDNPEHSNLTASESCLNQLQGLFKNKLFVNAVCMGLIIVFASTCVMITILFGIGFENKCKY